MGVLKELTDTFLPEDIGTWAYPANEKGVLPYAKGIDYFTRGLSLPDLDKENEREALEAILSQSERSVTRNGMYVGVERYTGKEKESERLKFHKPFTEEQAAGGEQPPITAKYPRVVFPATGESQYGILIMTDLEFGLTHESHTIVYNPSMGGFHVPNEIPCEEGVIAALKEFGNGTILPGEYRLSLEVVRNPIVCARIDGWMPINSVMLHEGKIRLELPIGDMVYTKLCNDISSFHSIGGIENTPMPQRRKNPMNRIILASQKYIEIPALFDLSPKQGVVLGECSLEYQNQGDSEPQSDSAKLTYVPLRRHESVAGTTTNPNLGLVEVQIDRAARLNNVHIDFKPIAISRETLTPRINLPGYLSDLGGDRVTRSLGTSRGLGGYDSIFDAPRSVSTGRTELRDAKTGDVSPKVKAEWEGHITTLRFCLTNEIS